MINILNIGIGLLVLIINLLPLILKKPKYYSVTLIVSLLVVLIRVLFVK